MTLYFNTAVVKEGGAEPVIESLNITPSAQQQLIEAPSGVDGYSPITVEAAAQPVIESLSVTPTTSEQLIEAPEGVDGYSPITVAAISVEPDILYGGWENTGVIAVNNRLLSSIFENSYEYCGEAITLGSNAIYVEAEKIYKEVGGELVYDGYKLIFNRYGSAFCYYNTNDMVYDTVADDGNIFDLNISNSPSTLYLVYDLSYSPMSSYILTTPQNYDLVFSFDISYDPDNNLLSIYNFQRIQQNNQGE